MNYRHAFHAGNFADVAKHLALVACLQALARKEKGFAVIDSHAGRGLYDLSGDEASRTGEAAAGIGKLIGMDGAMPAALRAYLAGIAAAGEGRYPGSPWLAASLLRPQDRLVAIEKQREEAVRLRRTLAPFARAGAVEGDGYTRLPALLPPPERRGLVLIDPPYEADGEFEQAAQAFAAAYRRFATGVYLVWFPIKSAAAAEAFCGEILSAGVAKALRWDIAVSRADQRLSAAGLVLVNPPFGVADVLDACAAHLGPRLDAQFTLRWLAGAE